MKLAVYCNDKKNVTLAEALCIDEIISTCETLLGF
jgi:hypothetical protein